MRFHQSLVLTACVLTLGACGNSSAPITVGPPAVVIKSAGDNQSAEDGTPLAVPPAVIVRDANGNAVAAVTVIFAVGTGGGSVTGGTQATNASGVATVGSWTLGTVGPNTLTATAGSLPPMTFNATATLRAACSVATPHTIGTTSNGQLAITDCRLSDGAYVDFFTTTVSPAGAYVFTEVAPIYDAYLNLYGSDGWIVGFNDDAPNSTSHDSRIKALLPSANFVLGATSYSPGVTGSYALSSAQISASITNCEEVFAARGISTTQNLEATDCNYGALGFYSDDIAIFLRQGQMVTVTMNSTAFDAALELWNSNGVKVASNDDANGTTNAQMVYTVPADDFYIVVPTSHVSGATGPYTLIIQ